MKTIQPDDRARAALRGMTVAVIGYGNQGHAHAMNLRDSGHRVLVGQRFDSPRFDAAQRDGFEPTSARDAAAAADLVILALPDESMPNAWSSEIAPALRPASAIGLIHGLNIRFGWIDPPPTHDVLMVAPKGPGRLVRSAFADGRGIPAMIAVHRNATGRARDLAVAWACGIGADRAAIIETTFAEECEADLFGEQAVLCGGVIELMKAGFETLVHAGYPPELAYFECVHEVRQIVDLVCDEGLAGMRRRISNTAEYGGLTRGPRIVSAEVRAAMRAVLDEIRSGRFAAEWRAEAERGMSTMAKLAEAEQASAVEAAGGIVRGWITGAPAAPQLK